MSSREDRRRRAADKLPPQSRIPQNLDERPMFKVEEYGVSSWTPERDGKGTLEAVVFHIKVRVGEKEFVELGLRLKSARAVDELIALLERNRNNVWPEHKENS